MVPGVAPNDAMMPAGPAIAPGIAAIPGTPPPLEERALPQMTPSGALADGTPSAGAGAGDRSLDGAGQTPEGAPAPDDGSALGLAGGAAVALVALSAMLA